MNDLSQKKLLKRLGLIYVIIVSLINYLGYLMPSSGQMPVRKTSEFSAWIAFMDSHNSLITVLSSFSFVIPFMVCLLYIYSGNSKNVTKRIINIPFTFSIFGGLGWFLAFCLELCFLIYFKFSTGIPVFSIVLNSLLNIVQECLFICTFTFFTLDAIHRKFILPKVFPEGKLNSYEGTVKLSSKLLFVVFFLSVNVFPIFYLSSTLFNLSTIHDFEINNSIYYALASIVILGIVLVINFSNYFSVPIKKLRDATNEIKRADYSKRVKIVSCDDLGELADNFNDMSEALDEKTKKILAIQDSIIRGMAVMVESRDNSTGGHINRTSDCVRVFINQLIKKENFKNLSPSFCAAVIKAAPMHDLGKIAVDDAVLRKPGRFTDEEYEIMKRHSAEGARIVEHVLKEVDDLEFKSIAINVAHYHHEKWNGTGYPEKISGKDIPIEARIMALADVFDALVSKRCYKDSMSYDKAFGIIEESLGSHFDPDLGKVFIECRPLLEELYSHYQ